MVELESLPIKLQALVDKINEGQPTTREGIREYYGYIESRLSDLVVLTQRCRKVAYTEFDLAESAAKKDMNYELMKPLIEEYGAVVSGEKGRTYCAEVNGRNIFFELSHYRHSGWSVTEDFTPRICVENAKRRKIVLTDLRNLDRVRAKIKAILYAD